MEVISLYEMELSPNEIISIMKNNIFNHYEEQSILKINKTYTIQRKSIISLINKISHKMGLKSQTFYLAINYLDIVFSKQNQIPYDYGLLAIACLVISAKYCENVTSKPIFKYFVNLYNEEMEDDKFKITKENLINYEITICKILNYKLNYYSVYDFNFFFFGNGIIKIEQLKLINNDILTMNNNNLNSSSYIKKILMKIYERSRHYLDVIIDNLICLKYSSLLISICIMEKSVDYVLLNELYLQNEEDSFDIENIRFNNKNYFRQIMKDFYKIDYESYPEYEYLKIDCENYKLFDDIYNKDNKLNESSHLNQMINCNIYNFDENNNSSSKKLNNSNIISYNQSPNVKSIKNKSNNINEVKDKINYLYKKVNLSVLTQNNRDKNNANKIRKKNNKRISFLNENSFFVNENNQNKNNLKILLTMNNFYQKNMNPNNIKRTMSNNKNNYYMKKCNTSSSPFKNIPNSNMEHLNSSNNKSKLINRMKNLNTKIYEGSEEGFTTNSNSIDAKKYNSNTNQLLNNNKNKKNINITKPYIKKIIQNYDKVPMDENKKNSNINVSNHKVLFEGLNKNKEGNKKIIKKLLISKYLNNSNILRGRSLVNKTRGQNNGSKMDKSYNFDSSPVFERNNSNYRAYHFNKRNIPVNDMSNISITNNNSNSNFQEIENKSLKNYYNKNKSPFQNYKSYKINSKYILYNSSLTSRNSLQFNKNNNNNKLTDSFMNMQMNYLKNDINQIDKNNISTSIYDYNNYNKAKDYSLSNGLQDYQNYNQNNNSMYETNYLENYKNKKIIKFKKNDMINTNINNNDKNKKIKYIENNKGNIDRRHKSLSNANMPEYSINLKF